MHRTQDGQGHVHLGEGGDDDAADDQGDGRAAHKADIQDGHGARQLLPREGVGEQGIGGRAVHRLARSHAGAGDEQGPETAGQATGGGRQAPDGHADGDHRLAAAPVGQEGQGETQEQVDDAERQPDQDAHLSVGEPQVLFDGLQQQAEDVAVDLREPEHQREDPEGPPCRLRWGPGLGGGSRLGDGRSLVQHWGVGRHGRSSSRTLYHRAILAPPPTY